MKQKSVFVIVASYSIVAFFFCTVVVAQIQTNGTDPLDLLDKMRQVYANAETYRDSGSVITSIKQNMSHTTLTKPFTIIFKRPGLLRVEWSASFGGRRDPYTLYSNSDGTWVYNERIKQIQKVESLEQAVRRWSGVSGGSTRTVPSMLLNIAKQPQFGGLIDLEYVGVELVGVKECHKMCATRRSQPLCLWIGVGDYLLRKISVDTPFGDVVEIHEEIELNNLIDDESLFTPPHDAEIVKKFQLGRGIKQ